MSFNRDTIIHLLAGGCGGTMGAIFTCPLEVVKTRLQSSSSGFSSSAGGGPSSAPLLSPASARMPSTTCSTLPRHRYLHMASRASNSQMMQFELPNPHSQRSMSIFHCLKHIVTVEGWSALFRGLGPNLVGVAPSRAIYFCSYSQAKKILNSSLPHQDTPFIHVCAASCAGFTACTATNPIWFVKTRVQLHQSSSSSPITTFACIRAVYEQSGISGFYRGITASYYGISETVIHFVIYEFIKAQLQSNRHAAGDGTRTSRDYLEYMLAAATSKTIASTLCYPHEVARTRLREDGAKYRGFWQTLATVSKEEGTAGLYRGLATQLVRQIPNTAIMMATYEGVVYLASKWAKRYYDDRQNEFYYDDNDED